MDQATILLIEDNPDDVELTLHALQKNHMANDVVVANDGAEGLDYLFRILGGLLGLQDST